MTISGGAQVGHQTRLIFKGDVNDKTRSSVSKAHYLAPNHKRWFL